jgi:hypothetical protein
MFVFQSGTLIVVVMRDEKAMLSSFGIRNGSKILLLAPLPPKASSAQNSAQSLNSSSSIDDSIDVCIS